MHKRPVAQGLYDPRFEHDSCGVGFIADLNGEETHETIGTAKEILLNMRHRGALGADENTGDGAGLLCSFPESFFRNIAKQESMNLPEDGLFGIGTFFFARDRAMQDDMKDIVHQCIAAEHCTLYGWRKVPIDETTIGNVAKLSMPTILQAFIGAPNDVTKDAFERSLYIIRKQSMNKVTELFGDDPQDFYSPLVSCKRIVYKGMLTSGQLFSFYADLQNPEFKAYLAVVHSRFSTNTFPSWDRAHPYRIIAHNGEINTIQGNRNYMRTRQGTLKSEVFGEKLGKTFPIVEEHMSDAGIFDNAIEFLIMNGFPLSLAAMYMVPEAWENDETMDPAKRAMYEAFSCVMEPWDGPASIVFTDGESIGAVLDRNGLRPSRYYFTHDNKIIMASEVGTSSVDPKNVKVKGRLRPGRMFLIDCKRGTIIEDQHIKDSYAKKYPFEEWIKSQKITLKDAKQGHVPESIQGDALSAQLRLYGYSDEHLRLILRPLAERGKDPLGSMGNDVPLAVLSQHPRLVYEYFKQRFAQVTNPPVDSIREQAIMSIETYIGPQTNLLKLDESQCQKLFLEHPILRNSDFTRLCNLKGNWEKVYTCDITFPHAHNTQGFFDCIEHVCEEVEKAVDNGSPVIILSDRAAGSDRVPVSPLYAVGAAHQHLIQVGKRTKVALVVESGEPREVHHFCCLLGFGADAINPYLAFDAIEDMVRTKSLPSDIDAETAQCNYLNGLAYGMRKVFAKMGISTLSSYKGAQIFEIIGLGKTIVQRCFKGAFSRIGGADFQTAAEHVFARHGKAYPTGNIPIGYEVLSPGDYQWRTDGEVHMWDPTSVQLLQQAVRTDDYSVFKKFSAYEDEKVSHASTLRGFFNFRKRVAIPIEEVESIEAITKRFVTGAMSFGSISQEAHETLALAMNALGGKSNTGEGGELAERYIPLPDGSSKRSAIKQVASGRFGVTIEYLSNADEIQIKMAQGAKPGEGGELPGHKVFPIIAKVRSSTPGIGLISPPPHHDIYSIEDLKQLIFDLKNANPQARISVKLVSEVGVGTIASGVAKAHADHILISGHDGGTGASALTGIKNAGSAWELGLAETHQTLVLNDLRSRVILQTDGQIKTGRDVVIAALLGAEECGFATAPLIAMGCIMMRKCEKNTCPVGIATQDARLRKKFTGEPIHVERMFRFIAKEVREIMASLGVRTFNELIGRVDLIDVDSQRAIDYRVDLRPVLTKMGLSDGHTGVFCSIPQKHAIEHVLDKRILKKITKDLEQKKPVTFDSKIWNTDRTTGAIISNALYKMHGAEGIPKDTVRLNFTGTAGQSFGAWLIHGMFLYLEGDANDYVGKGLSGGKIAILPPKESDFLPEENIIIGNVAFYGATKGEAYIRGIAAERFAVRNSGARVVVEGIGDHGCEYMTGGCVVVLGSVGRNFAAGMSGGVAYVWDANNSLEQQLNRELSDMYSLDDRDKDTLFSMIEQHVEHTQSSRGQYLLTNFEKELSNFVKVISPSYQEYLNKQIEKELAGNG